MAGTREGGIKAYKTNIERHGEDFYHNNGKKGGGAKYTGKRGFAANPALAKVAGAKGGSHRWTGREGYKLVEEQGDKLIYKNEKGDVYELYGSYHKKVQVR